MERRRLVERQDDGVRDDRPVLSFEVVADGPDVRLDFRPLETVQLPGLGVATDVRDPREVVDSLAIHGEQEDKAAVLVEPQGVDRRHANPPMETGREYGTPCLCELWARPRDPAPWLAFRIWTHRPVAAACRR